MIVLHHSASLEFYLGFFLNSASPTANASSISRISGVLIVAIEKANRDRIPLEYVRIGLSKASPSSVNSCI